MALVAVGLLAHGANTQAAPFSQNDTEQPGQESTPSSQGSDEPSGVASEVEISDVAGMSADEAIQEMSDAGLPWSDMRFEQNPQPVNTLVSTDPPTVRLEIPRIGNSPDACGRTLAYVYLDAHNEGSYEHLFNEDQVEFGLARTTAFSHEHRREFERLREQAEERDAGLWDACPEVEDVSFVVRQARCGGRLVEGRSSSGWGGGCLRYKLRRPRPSASNRSSWSG